MLKHVARLKNSSADDSSYDGLSKRIVMGQYTPGSSLSGHKITDDLGLSRTPVCEILIRLRIEGLARIVPRASGLLRICNLCNGVGRLPGGLHALVLVSLLSLLSLSAVPAHAIGSNNNRLHCQVPSYLGPVLANQAEWPIASVDNRSQSKTPPMGFSYWNGFGDDPGPSDELSRQIADALVETGLRDAGYKYFLAFDGGWWSTAVNPPRDANGYPRIDAVRWPNGIQPVADYIHMRGLKVGGYTDIGTVGYCLPPEIGVRGHEQEDANQFAQWGWDYIKVDDHGPGNFESIARALANNSSHRPIVLSLSTPATFPYEFAPRIANLWRVGDDITARLGTGEWNNILREFDVASHFWWAQAPGRWNDLDMLVIGTFGIDNEEAKSHFSMWAVRGAPLFIGVDIRAPHIGSAGPIPRATTQDLEILENAEVIAVDQDSLGASGRVVGRRQDGRTEVDAKPLGSFASGEYAVLLLNRSGDPQDITVTWESLGLLPAQAKVRDLWKHADVGSIPTQFTARGVPAHGARMLRVEGRVNWSLPREYEAEWSFNQFYGRAHVHCLRSIVDDASNQVWPRKVQVPWATVVEGIGGGPENKLQFNELWEGKDGTYHIVIRYASAQSRRARITVNGASPFWLQFPATGADTRFGTVQARVHLKVGENTVTFDNPTNLAPSIDKIVVAAERRRNE